MTETMIVMSPDITSLTLMSLEEYVMYNISVRAYTSVGPGVYSEGTEERTFEDSEKISNCKLLNHSLFFTEPATPPVNVMATATSPRSISVMWENVLEIDQNGIITMYEVLDPVPTPGDIGWSHHDTDHECD